jgi:hypothetical protein
LKVSEEIRKIELREEFRICPNCGCKRVSQLFFALERGHTIVFARTNYGRR